MKLTTQLRHRSLLAAESLRLVRQFFEKETQHRPSPFHYAALESITDTLAAMAEGRVDPKVFLSSLDPGVGKTTAVSAFVETLIADPTYSHVGVMICVARLDEINGMLQRMGVPKEHVAVLTSDKEVNALGGAEVNQAQVLFTTQQRLEKHLDGECFVKAEEFYYQDRPRSVRIWDETWLPGVSITVTRDDLSAMLKQLRPVCPKLTERLDDVIREIKELGDGCRVDVPDFEQEYGVDLNSALSIFDASYADITAVSSLWHMSGRTVTVRNDGAYGPVMLTYRQTLPDDLAPMIVLDASGRVRETYPEMERHRGNIHRLTPAGKRYDNLNLHIWRRGGGKTSWAKVDDFREMLEGIVSTIMSKPDEEWLIVTHKPGGKVRNIQRAIVDMLGGDFDTSKLHFINWGRHMATNEYANVQNVILAGTLFFRPSHYEALGRLAADRHPSHDYSKEDQERIAKGEHLHGILQALCRGSVRQCRGDSCAPCNAYVIASVGSGIPQALPTVFPGARIHDWKPKGRVLKGKVLEALAYIDQRLAQGNEVIKFTEVKKAIGMRDSSNFYSDIRQHEDFRAELAERGLVEWGSNRKTAFRVVNAAYFGFEEVA